MRILIIEDDATLAQAIQFGLEKEGHEASFLTDGEAGWQELTERGQEYDLAIIDWMLPNRAGVEICRGLRERNLSLPVMLLTGRTSSEDKVTALDVGADDYLTKPFSLAELAARVKALSRRPRRILGSEISLGKLVLDTKSRSIKHDNQTIPLTLKEYAILEYLMRHPNQVMTREQILDHVWDYNFDSFSNIVDVHINNLRKKITRHTDSAVLETIRGVGYCVKAA